MPQSQQECLIRPQRPPIPAVIALVDLAVGLPLSVLMVVLLQPRNAPHRLEDWLIAGPMALAACGLFLAGLLLVLRQRLLARTFQWLAAVGGLLFLLGIAYNAFRVPLVFEDARAVLSFVAIVLAALGILLLPLWLRRLEED